MTLLESMGEGPPKQTNKKNMQQFVKHYGIYKYAKSTNDADSSRPKKVNSF